MSGQFPPPIVKSKRPHRRLDHVRDNDVEDILIQRRDAMQTLRDNGWTFQQIGDLYKISRQRAEQIIKARYVEDES